jgi:hypothetical protein
LYTYPKPGCALTKALAGKFFDILVVVNLVQYPTAKGCADQALEIHGASVSGSRT